MESLDETLLLIMSREELEFSKLFFAREYYTNQTRENAIAICAKIFGRRMQIDRVAATFPIAAANQWPDDPIVQEEIKKLTGYIPTAEEMHRDLWIKAQIAFKAGNHKEYNNSMKLLAEMTGNLKGEKNDGKTNGSIPELIAAIVDSTNRRDN